MLKNEDEFDILVLVGDKWVGSDSEMGCLEDDILITSSKEF